MNTYDKGGTAENPLTASYSGCLKILKRGGIVYSISLNACSAKEATGGTERKAAFALISSDMLVF